MNPSMQVNLTEAAPAHLKAKRINVVSKLAARFGIRNHEMKKKSPPSNKDVYDGFINVPVKKHTRAGLHELKAAMNVSGQGEVIEKLVDIALAIQKAAR